MLDQLPGIDAGVLNDDIDAAVLLQNLCDCCIGLVEAGNVGADKCNSNLIGRVLANSIGVGQNE